ncbi:MAG: glycosyltransferase [Anaerolineales bacterium]|nr:glycosyltransferase [Anaerolineales bacterium]
MDNPKPLVSIFSVVKNRAYTIRRCVESVLSQDYSNIEFIIQDGASTDGTLAILQDYATKYPQAIKLVSQPDASAEEGFFRALRRCTGEIIGSCLSDEELLPQAVGWAADNMSQYPEVAAIYGDCHISDLEGNITHSIESRPFSMAAYLCHEVVPPFAASFFRRSCLEQIGLSENQWLHGVGEFELWVKLGIKYPILYVPGFVAKFGVHPGSNTAKPSIILELISPRVKMMGQLFNDSTTPAEIRSLEPRAYAGLHLWVTEGMIGMNELAEAKSQIMQALRYQPDPERLAALMEHLSQRGVNLGEVYTKALDLFSYTPEELKQKGLIYYERGDLSSAALFLEKASEHFPRDVELLLNLGAIYYDLQRFSEALKWFKQATQFNPANPGAWVGMAATADRLGDQDIFQWAFQQARSLSPNHPVVVDLAKRYHPSYG